MSQRIGNFAAPGSMLKGPLRDRLKKKELAQHDRPGNSETHLALLRQMPCAVTLKMPAGEVHHLQNGIKDRGLGMRSQDRWGLPLLHHLHMELHAKGSRNEPGWFLKHGIADPLGLANALWHATGDLPKMIAILMEHRSP